MDEVNSALGFAEGVEQVADCIPERVAGAEGHPAKEGLELGEGQLDRVLVE